MELLIRSGSRSLDAPTKDGLTPLHMAAMNGRESTIELLLHLGSQTLDAPDENGKTPLHLAIRFGYESTVELLLRCRSQSLNAPDIKGRIPLYLALRRSNIEIVKILKAIGTSTSLNVTKLNAAQIAMLHKPLSEAEMIAIRFRIYFDHSLVSLLLLYLNRSLVSHLLSSPHR